MWMMFSKIKNPPILSFIPNAEAQCLIKRSFLINSRTVYLITLYWNINKVLC